jgi:hypothetical protein
MVRTDPKQDIRSFSIDQIVVLSEQLRSSPEMDLRSPLRRATEIFRRSPSVLHSILFSQMAASGAISCVVKASELFGGERFEGNRTSAQTAPSPDKLQLVQKWLLLPVETG